MSKANRRRQRPGNQPTSRPTGTQPAGQPSPVERGGHVIFVRRRRDTTGRRHAPGRRRLGRDLAPGHSPSDRHGLATELDRPARPPRAPASDLQAVIHGALPDRDHRRGGDRRRRRHLGFRLLLGLAAGLRLHDHLDARADRLAQSRRHREPRLRPAGHGQQPRRSWQQGDLHVLRPRIGIALQHRGRRADRRPGLRSGRQRHPAGLDPQPRTWRPGRPLPGDQRGRHTRWPGEDEGLLRGLPTGTELRSGHRPVRPDELAIPGDPVGSRPAPRHVR